MDVGDKVRYHGIEYELVARTQDGRPIIDRVKPSNMLDGYPHIVDENLLTLTRGNDA
jgi:hypothetical protein